MTKILFLSISWIDSLISHIMFCFIINKINIWNINTWVISWCSTSLFTRGLWWTASMPSPVSASPSAITPSWTTCNGASSVITATVHHQLSVQQAAIISRGMEIQGVCYLSVNMRGRLQQLYSSLYLLSPCKWYGCL